MGGREGGTSGGHSMCQIQGVCPSHTDISWGAGRTPPDPCTAPQGPTVHSKTITVAFRAATWDQKTHSWIFPEVRQDLKGEKYNMAGKLPEAHCKRDSTGREKGWRQENPQQWHLSGPHHTVVAQKATSNKALELAAFSQPKRESK